MLSICLVLKFIPLQDLRAVERADRFFEKIFLYDHMTSEVRALDSLGFIFLSLFGNIFLSEIICYSYIKIVNLFIVYISWVQCGMSPFASAFRGSIIQTQ